MGDSPFPPGSLVTLYARDSGGNKQEMSIEQQEQAFRDWCKANGYIPGRIFIDRHKPGGSVVDRDQFNALIKYFEGSPKETGIVFFDYSRFARDFDDSSYFLASLRRRGYTPYSIENYVPSGSTGKVVEALYLWSAEEYRHQLSINVKRGVRALIRNYKGWPNATPPRGYQFESVKIAEYLDGEPHMCNRLAPHPGEAPLVRRAFELAASGLSLGEIRKEVGLYYEITGVRGMLKNKIYIGIYQHSGLTVDDFCPPIVDRVLFEKVQAIRKEAVQRRSYYHPRAVASTYLLSGLVVCGLCGHGMNGTSYKRWRYYHCHRIASRTADTCPNGRISADILEADVLRRVRQVLETPDILQAVFAEYEELGAVQNADADLIRYKQTELDDLKEQIKRVTDGIAKRPDSSALLDKLDELEKQQAEGRETLATLEARQFEILRYDDLDRMRKQLHNAMLSAQNERQQQLIIRALKPTITVNKGDGYRNVRNYTGEIALDFGVEITLPLP
jgi:DNA invertase Pin-like site-specific DNA recombinase